ncbi:MAG: 1-deoxy-D-xylulose-5-phosphate synthase [bacterium]|nr:1-deoxy-D-xylulose-5-phosphate synthase [Planctomycetota bacterium]HIL51685.1 1-deoxy-D-xylulose-5-phosphate synthase [Planctomycetota bacterium]
MTQATPQDKSVSPNHESKLASAEQVDLLEGIHSPEDLKALDLGQLPGLCGEIREFLLDSVQQTGGHLGSNLGTVELSCALHYTFDFRRDRLVWDVSHQSYTHKLLTGRREDFASLRQTDGLCGFTHPCESEYDLFHTGHAGTSISLALGLSLGVSHEPDPPKAVAVIGDASMGAGVAFEAINHAGALGQNLLVILNDNEWSISKSVGAMARYFSRLRSTRLLQRAHQEIQTLISAIPVIGPRVDRTLDQIGEVVRHSLVPGHVFEELGVTYVGPIDGHDVKRLVETLERVRELDGVVLVHVLTAKGKGYPDAHEHPEHVHAVKPRAAVPGSGREDGKLRKENRSPASGPAFTQCFSKSLLAAAEGDMRIHAITAAMPSGTGLDAFAERFPARFHDTGITEQHALAMAAGLAKAGSRPVVAIYSTFLQRGFDQVFQEIALQGLPVVLCLDRAGLVGADGPTHNGVFDIAYLRTLPNMILAAPRDGTDLGRMLTMALGHTGPVALRFPRAATPTQERIHPGERRALAPGKAEVLCEGGSLVIWAYGALVNTACDVADELRREGIEIGVVDARFAKPLDSEMLGLHAREYRHILCLEDHQRMGGFGSAVLEAHARLPAGGARVRCLGIPDRYIEHKSSREEQLASLGLDVAGVRQSVRNLLVSSRV